MPRCIVFSLSTGYCGMDRHEFGVFPDDVTDEELDGEAWQLALSNAESHGVYPYEDMPEDYDEEEAGWYSVEYYGNIEGSWEDFDPEKHDGLVPGGGSATKLFSQLLKEFNE